MLWCVLRRRPEGRPRRGTGAHALEEEASEALRMSVPGAAEGSVKDGSKTCVVGGL